LRKIHAYEADGKSEPVQNNGLDEGWIENNIVVIDEWPKAYGLPKLVLLYVRHFSTIFGYVQKLYKREALINTVIYTYISITYIY